MTADVVITGFGAFSAFGFGRKPLFDGVFSGEPAFRAVTRFDASGYRCDRAATCDTTHAGSPGPSAFDVLAACCAEALDMADGLNPAALDAVKQWVYEPTVLNGTPTDVETEIEVNFSLTP